MTTTPTVSPTLTVPRSKVAARSYRATGYGREAVTHVGCHLRPDGEVAHGVVPVEVIARAAVRYRGFGTGLKVSVQVPFLQKSTTVVSVVEDAARAFHTQFPSPGELRVAVWFSSAPASDETLEAVAVAVLRGFAEATELILSDEQLSELVRGIGFMGGSVLPHGGFISDSGHLEPVEVEPQLDGRLLVLRPREFKCSPTQNATSGGMRDEVQEALRGVGLGQGVEITGGDQSGCPMVVIIPGAQMAVSQVRQAAVTLREVLGEAWDVVMTRPGQGE